MKRTKFTEEQIAFALRQAETGNRVEEVCRQLGISQATFFNWKKKFGGLGISELRRLRQLEEENSHLKNLMAELKSKIAIEESLDLHVHLVVNDPEKEKPIYTIAKKQGVLL